MQEYPAAVAFVPSSKLAFTCSQLCGQILLFDYHTATVAAAIELPQVLCSLSAAPATGALAAGGTDGSLFLTDTASCTWQELQGHAGAVRACAVACDGSAVLSTAGSTVMRWDAGLHHVQHQ